MLVYLRALSIIHRLAVIFSTSFPALDVYDCPEFRSFFRFVEIHWSSFLNHFLLDLVVSFSEEELGEVGELTEATAERTPALPAAARADIATASVYLVCVLTCNSARTCMYDIIIISHLHWSISRIVYFTSLGKHWIYFRVNFKVL